MNPGSSVTLSHQRLLGARPWPAGHGGSHERDGLVEVRRLRPGMTLAEVEALLGGPAADSFEMPADYPAYRWQREWREGGEVVVVQFFADGRVMAAQGRGRPQPGPLARLRAWLGW